MARRREPPDALDYFPTPPWATRALFRRVLPALGGETIASVWEPACGEGHMAEVVTEFALDLASEGVAMLVRTQWIEGIGRYEKLFRDRPPTIFAPFVERVPMVKGRWDPDASTATSYA